VVSIDARMHSPDGIEESSQCGVGDLSYIGGDDGICGAVEEDENVTEWKVNRVPARPGDDASTPDIDFIDVKSVSCGWFYIYVLSTCVTVRFSKFIISYLMNFRRDVASLKR